MTDVFRKRIVSLVLAIIALVPAAGRAQKREFSTVEGRVHVRGGDVGTMWIQLQQLGMTVREQVSTNGEFAFPDVPYGDYTLVIRIMGHDSVSKEISVPSETRLTIDVGTRARTMDSVTTSLFELHVPRSARRQYERGQDSLRIGDCAGALKHLIEAVRLFGTYADAYNAIGNCYVRLNNPTLAEEAFKNAIDLTMSVYPAVNLADVYVKQGRLEEADSVLTRAIRRDPAHGDGYYGLALLRVEQQRLDEAERLANQAHDHPRHIADTHLLLAKIHQRQGRLDLISADLRSYVSEAKPNPTRDRILKALGKQVKKKG